MNKKNAASKGARPAKKPQSNITGLVVRIGRRDFDYDKVRDETLHAPLIDVPVNQLTIFQAVMQEQIPTMESNPIDDGNVRVVRVKPELYEVISGRNTIVAAIYEFKKVAHAAAEKPENLHKSLDELGIKIPTISTRLASWKRLNPCEVPPPPPVKLDSEELKNRLASAAATATVAVRLPKEKPLVPIAALLQPPVQPAKVVAPSSGKFGRIFSGAAVPA